MRRTLLPMALAALAGLAFGCGGPLGARNHTTLELRTGQVLRGDIVAANATERSIVFELAPDWTMSVMGIPVGPDGERVTIATDDVREIEHVEPWKLPVYWTMVAVGSALMTGGGAMMLLSDEPDSAGPIVLGFGAAVTIPGLIYAVITHVHLASSEAQWRKALGPSTSPHATPPAAVTRAPGGVVSWTFDGL